MSANNHAIYENLRGSVCACGQPKAPGKSFCRDNYFALPKEERAALYKREGYPETYRHCLELLGLKEPSLAPRPEPETPAERKTRRIMTGLKRALQ